MIGRRSFITGLISFVAAPAIVRAGSLMPVKVMEPIYIGVDFGRGPMMVAFEAMKLDHAEKLIRPPFILVRKGFKEMFYEVLTQ